MAMAVVGAGGGTTVDDWQLLSLSLTTCLLFFAASGSLPSAAPLVHCGLWLSTLCCMRREKQREWHKALPPRQPHLPPSPPTPSLAPWHAASCCQSSQTKWDIGSLFLIIPSFFPLHPLIISSSSLHSFLSFFPLHCFILSLSSTSWLEETLRLKKTLPWHRRRAWRFHTESWHSSATCPSQWRTGWWPSPSWPWPDPSAWPRTWRLWMGRWTTSGGQQNQLHCKYHVK